MRTAFASAAAAVFALLLSPGVALACAVCFQAKTDASRIAFIASTAAMTGLPLLLVLGVAWWVRKQFREARHQLDQKPSRLPSH